VLPQHQNFVDASDISIQKPFNVMRLRVTSMPQLEEFCVATNPNGLVAGAGCRASSDELSKFNGLSFLPVGINAESGSDMFASGANIWISSVDVVASGAGTLTAANFEGLARWSAKVSKGSKQIKLSSGNNPFQLAMPPTAEDGDNSLVWVPKKAGDTLTIQCVSGVFIPSFGAP
jgi:hypothetical protein